MTPENISNKKILISPLDWGKGHVSRCIGLIDTLIKQDNQVIIACDSFQEHIFTQYFPTCTIVNHTGYGFQFKGNGRFGIDLVSQFNKFRKRIKLEKMQVEYLVKSLGIDVVLSDHRYGFRSKMCTSIFITHQVSLPIKWYEFGVQAIHKAFMQRFHLIWIMDKETDRLAGKLSSAKGILNAFYIGHYSRFSRYDAVEKDIPHMVIVSGPEPYAEQFFRQQYALAFERKKRTVFITSEDYFLESQMVSLDIVLTGDWLVQDTYILRAREITSLFGYSTLMDLHFLQVPAILTPTKGQKEQLYLSKYHEGNFRS
jgi:UDP:flavonoid glycosyltransferase YjiC (YdhE family)